MDDISNAVIERLARMETKLDTVLSTMEDHETRIRINEQKREECQQVDNLKDIKDTLVDHSTRIGTLETTHNQDEGAKIVKRSSLEYSLAAATILELIIIIWQATRTS